MRLRRWTFLVALLGGSGCAHVPAPEPHASDEISIGHVSIVLRYTAVDAREAARMAGALRLAVPVAERWGRLAPELTITIHPTHDALEAASRSPGVWWLRAWSRRTSVEVQSPRTWSNGAASDAELTRLLAHELTHCAMFEAIGGEQRLGSIPAWFREGMATSNAGERFSVAQHRDAVGSLVVDAAFREEAAPLAYAAANDAFLALEHRYGRARVREILSRVRGGARFGDAFRDALGISVRAFEADYGVTAHTDRRN